MKRCVYLFLLSILLVAGLTACGSGKAEQEVPSLTEIEGMTNDEAAEALSGFCRQDILDAWGKPGGGLSGLGEQLLGPPGLLPPLFFRHGKEKFQLLRHGEQRHLGQPGQGQTLAAVGSL